MTSRVSTLLNVGREGHYAFVLLEWYQFSDAVRDEINRQADGLGHAMGENGTFVTTFPQSWNVIAAQVAGKPWPEKITKRFETESDPIILIFGGNWQAFDPNEDGYAIIWLSDFHEDPSRVPPVIKDLALRTRRGDNVIEYLHGVAKRERVREASGGFARLASYIEIKPSIFGVEIDVKAILTDLGTRRT